MTKLTFGLLFLSAIMAGSLLAATKMSKIEKAQARFAKIQFESNCLLKLVDDVEITKTDLAEIWINDGTCLNYVKRLAKKSK